MRAALKEMPPILLCWPAILDADVTGKAVKAEPSHQYPIIITCVTDESRGVLWQKTSDMEAR